MSTERSADPNGENEVEGHGTRSKMSKPEDQAGEEPEVKGHMPRGWGGAVPPEASEADATEDTQSSGAEVEGHLRGWGGN